MSKEDKRCANNKPFAHPTLAGTFAGTGFSTTLDFISNSNAFGKYSQPIQQTIKLAKPVISSAAQEIVGKAVENTINK